MMKRWIGGFLVMGLATVCAAAAMTGGFQLRVEAPSGESDMALLVRTYRCNQPEKAQVSGTAEGVVDGERITRPIVLQTLRKGVYGLERQWPTEGRWMLAFYGRYQGQHASTLVMLDHDGKVALKQTVEGAELDVRVMNRKIARSDIDRALATHIRTR